MYILAIETTGPFGSAALINEENEILGHEVSKDTMSHLKDLVPMIQRMLEKAGIDGIVNNMTLPEAANVNLFTASQEIVSKYEKMPSSIDEAKQAAKQSKFISEIIPDCVLDYYTR